MDLNTVMFILKYQLISRKLIVQAKLKSLEVLADSATIQRLLLLSEEVEIDRQITLINNGKYL